MYILPACSCCQRRGPPPPRRDLRLSVRGIVFRAIGFSELLFYDWKTESKHGRQSRNLSWNQPTNANGGSAASTIMP